MDVRARWWEYAFERRRYGGGQQQQQQQQKGDDSGLYSNIASVRNVGDVSWMFGWGRGVWRPKTLVGGRDAEAATRRIVIGSTNCYCNAALWVPTYRYQETTAVLHTPHHGRSTSK